MRMIKVVTVLFAILLLTGCGFHLRGTAKLPPQLHTIYLQNSQSQYTPFMRQLHLMLKMSGVKLVDDPKQAPITLNVLSETSSTRETSIGGAQTARNYIVSYTVSYQLLSAKGKIIYGPKNISVQQNITLSANEVLTNSNKLNQAKTSLYEELVDQMAFQLTSDDIMKTLHATKT
ncbi:MAG: hypothetical protein A3C55_01630 [Gammaproteobacteria bacterium RIFCSPHIGHO2_02_FULL_42_13]|nr:MAG: hypothetical protein A3C55_01630 [Gammaproteobacteria bacterium RIFCSPHIGHO2_02_FULL_42_13]OGT70867.1 MAG: hypothetical protein A3H43_00940 [Gammaproteobacteria bacterium RIFCSPLOWO2_02_FULL_42_9]